MSEELKNVMANVIRINMIKEGRRDGTYVQFIVSEELIPAHLDEVGWIDKGNEVIRVIKKKWDVQMVEIRERHENSKGKSRTVSIIHKFTPFEFMRQMMGIVPTAIYYVRSNPDTTCGDRCVFAIDEVARGNFSFRQNLRQVTKSNTSARKALACDLAKLCTCSEVGKVLERNRKLVKEKLRNMGYKDRLEEVSDTLLQEYYMQHIGDVLCYSELPLEKITITEEFLNT